MAGAGQMLTASCQIKARHVDGESMSGLQFMNAFGCDASISLRAEEVHVGQQSWERRASGTVRYCCQPRCKL
jgi:hypothetical protein